MKTEEEIRELLEQTLKKVHEINVSEMTELLFMAGYEQAIRDVLEEE